MERFIRIRREKEVKFNDSSIFISYFIFEVVVFVVGVVIGSKNENVIEMRKIIEK